VEGAASLGQPCRQRFAVLLQQGFGCGPLRHHPDAECLVRIEFDVHGQVAELRQTQLEIRFRACPGVVGGIGVRMIVFGVDVLA